LKITKQEIRNHELSARKYISDYGVDDEIIFDHFGLQALSSDEYLELKNYFIMRGKIKSEIHYNGRRIGVFYLDQYKEDKVELVEPKPGQVFIQFDCFVEHVSFRTKDLDKLKKVFSDRIIKTFNIEESHGFKIQGPGQIEIEFRNNEL
jgi:hypothetical protein